MLLQHPYLELLRRRDSRTTYRNLFHAVTYCNSNSDTNSNGYSQRHRYVHSNTNANTISGTPSAVAQPLNSHGSSDWR